MLRNLNLVNSEVVPVDAYHLSSTIVTHTDTTRHSSGDGSSLLSPDHVPDLLATTCAPAAGADISSLSVDNTVTSEVAPSSVIEIKSDEEQSHVEQEFGPSVDIGVGEGGGELCDDLSRDDNLHHEQDQHPATEQYLVMSLAATSDKDSVWSDVEQVIKNRKNLSTRRSIFSVSLYQGTV